MLSKQNRIRKRNEFSYIYRKGKKIHSASFIICVLHKSDNIKIGFSLSKKRVGKAVLRNLIKRRLSEIIYKEIELIKPFKIIIQAKENIVNITYSELQNEIKKVFRENSLYK